MKCRYEMSKESEHETDPSIRYVLYLLSKVCIEYARPDRYVCRTYIPEVN